MEHDKRDETNETETTKMTETTRADRVADAVLQKFTRLEKKFKPRENEWVPLSGVVLELGE